MGFGLHRSVRLLLALALEIVLLAEWRHAVAQEPTAAVANGEVQHVDIGGRRLTMRVVGQGAPTVVIEPGFGLAAVESDEWKAVIVEVAKTNRVVTYDRAGLGSSDPPAKKPRTSRDVANDLHELLQRSGQPGPYVLVAHSIGGLHVRVFADAYLDDVAGVVLVDVAHPDQDQTWLSLVPAEAPEEDPALPGIRAFLQRRVADRGENPEAFDIVDSRAQVRAAKSLGDKPLAVLTHSPSWKMDPSLPDVLWKVLEPATQKLQAELATLSTNSTHRVAERAGHAIHVEDPALVIAAIREVGGKVTTKTAGGEVK